MYACFDDDEKRSAYPEASIIAIDENGFTVRSASQRTGHMSFLKIESYKGNVSSFAQALNWVKRKPMKQKGQEKQDDLPDPKF